MRRSEGREGGSEKCVRRPSRRRECKKARRRTTAKDQRPLTTAMNEDEMQLAQALAKMSGPRTPIQAKLKNKLQGFR